MLAVCAVITSAVLAFWRSKVVDFMSIVEGVPSLLLAVVLASVGKVASSESEWAAASSSTSTTNRALNGKECSSTSARFYKSSGAQRAHHGHVASALLAAGCTAADGPKPLTGISAAAKKMYQAFKAMSEDPKTRPAVYLRPESSGLVQFNTAAMVRCCCHSTGTLPKRLPDVTQSFLSVCCDFNLIVGELCR